MNAGIEQILRVWVPEVWDSVDVRVTPDSTITQVKAEALQRATGVACDPASYEVKYRGGVIADEEFTVEQLALPHRAPLIVLHVERRPVR